MYNWVKFSLQYSIWVNVLLLSTTEILLPPKYNEGELKFTCGAHNVEKLHFRSFQESGEHGLWHKYMYPAVDLFLVVSTDHAPHTHTLLCYSCKLDCEIDNSCVAIWLPWHLVIRPSDSRSSACLFRLPPPAHRHTFQYKKARNIRGGLRVWADSSSALFSGGDFQLTYGTNNKYSAALIDHKHVL